MRQREKVRYVKKMLHQRQIERAYYLQDVPIEHLTPDAQQDLFDHARDIVQKTRLFPKKVVRRDGVCTIMFVGANV